MFSHISTIVTIAKCNLALNIHCLFNFYFHVKCTCISLNMMLLLLWAIIVHFCHICYCAVKFPKQINQQMPQLVYHVNTLIEVKLNISNQFNSLQLYKINAEYVLEHNLDVLIVYSCTNYSQFMTNLPKFLAWCSLSMYVMQLFTTRYVRSTPDQYVLRDDQTIPN